MIRTYFLNNTNLYLCSKNTNEISIQIVRRYIKFRFLSKTLMNSVVARTNHLSCHVLIFDERGHSSIQEILITHRLFLVIAIYRQASLVNHSTSHVASWPGMIQKECSRYSEVPNRRACSLRFFRFSSTLLAIFPPARLLFYLVKWKIPPCSFINLLSK